MNDALNFCEAEPRDGQVPDLPINQSFYHVQEQQLLQLEAIGG